MMLPDCQRASQPQISAHEALQDLQALQRVRDFGMELHAVEVTRLVGHCRKRNAVGTKPTATKSQAAAHRRDRRDSSTHRTALCPRCRCDRGSHRAICRAPTPSLARSRTRGPCWESRDRRAASPSSACRSRCREQERRSSNTACGANGACDFVVDSGRTGENDTLRAPKARTSSLLMSHGWISQYTPLSRTRRAISCVYCAPKSRIRILSDERGCPRKAAQIAGKGQPWPFQLTHGSSAPLW